MPKIIDHDQYRRELLNRCFDIFALRGFATLTMRELAKELSVSTGTLYHYFPGKQEIFESLMEQLSQEDLINFLTLAGKPDTLEKRILALTNFAQSNEEYFLKQLFITMDCYRLKGGTAVVQNERMSRLNEEYRKSLSDYLGVDDPEILDLIFGAITGAVVGRMYEGDVISLERQGKLLAKMIEIYMRHSGGAEHESS